MVMVAAVLTMSAAQLLDLVTFMNMVRELGAGAEVNPLVAALYGTYGYPLVAISKVALLALVTAIVAVLISRAQRTHLAGALVALGIVIGIVGAASNLTALGIV